MRHGTRGDNLTVCYRKKKQIDVSFSCVCPGIDNDFCHNIVKVDPQLLDNVMTKFMINNRIDA